MITERCAERRRIKIVAHAHESIKQLIFFSLSQFGCFIQKKENKIRRKDVVKGNRECFKALNVLLL